MATELEIISVTVKVPFGGDRSVDTSSNVTIRELTEMVMSTCEPDTFRGTPQCIVQSGRILSDSSTLQDAGVSNGSVLHLMRRPREGRRIPGRSRSARQPRSRRTDGTDDPNSTEVSEAPEDALHNHDDDDDDDDDNDDHDHDHEHADHHVHTNVIIGHIAVDGRIRYNDAHDMLLSVLHAVGFSTRAVRSAAAVAAAIAIATQSSEDRGAASRAVLHNAWNGTRHLQEELSRDGSPSRPVLQNHGRTQSAPTDEATRPALVTAEASTDASGSQAKGSAAETAEEHDQQPPDAVSGPSVAAAAELESRTGAPNDEVPSPLSMPPLLGEDPPPTQDGETDLHASARATDRLLPVLAGLMEVAASRIRNAPSMMNLAGSDRLDRAEALTEQLGAVASVVTGVTTLVSTLLPDPDDLRTANRENGNRTSEGTQTSEQDAPQGDRPVDDTSNRTTSSSPNGNANASGSENVGQEAPPNGVTGSTDTNGSSRGSRPRIDSGGETGSRSETHSFTIFPPGIAAERNQAGSGPNGRIRRSRRVRVSSSQAANADFMIRVLSYYFCSLCDIRIPTGSGPPEVEGQTAVSVLDSLYGSNSTAQPMSPVLRIIHFAMQKLTPRQFHEICGGNMVPLAGIREELWDEVSRQVRRHHGPGVENGDVEELVVDHICEALHEFVHIVESADEAHEDGVFTPGPEDFCHHIMHIIQRRIEVLADILAVERSVTECSGRLSRWIKGALGEVLLAIATELEMQWDGLLVSFRRAAYEIGKTVVGRQFSVIFPCIANLFAGRARAAYQRRATQHPEARPSNLDRTSDHADTDGELDHSNCGPGCERRQDMLNEGSASQGLDDTDDDDLDDDFHDETDSDMPELGDGDDDEGSYDEDHDDMDENYSDMDDTMDADRLPNDCKTNPHNLDDAELRDLANELDAERKQTGAGTPVEGNLDDMDLDTLANDLASEFGTATGKSTAAAVPTSKPKKLPTGPSKRMAAMFPGETSSLRAPGVSPVLGTPGSMPSASFNRTAFSSAAIPRGGSSSGSMLKTDFENILGAQDGVKWKQVIDRDQMRVRERRYGPLSRGYSGETSVVPCLDEKRASDLAVDAAKEAAKAAKLPPERASELERVASECGSQYMKEMERAITSRLLSDPDFDRHSFPRAAKRFVPKDP